MLLQIRYQSDGQHSDRRTYDYSGNRKISTKIDAPLENKTGILSKKTESGIYYVTGDKIPIQIIVTKELTEAENLWLKSLTNELEQNETAEKLLEEYSKNQANALYRSVMELIVRANKQKFEEVKGMCDALRELMKDEIDAEVKKQVQEKINAEVESAVEITKKESTKATEKRINALIIALSKSDRMEDIIKAAKDHDYQQNLFKEFGL